MAIQQREFSLSSDLVKILETMAKGQKAEARQQIDNLRCGYNDPKCNKVDLRVVKQSLVNVANRQSAVILAKVAVPEGTPSELFALLDAILNLLPDDKAFQTQLQALVNENQTGTAIRNAMQELQNGDTIKIGRDPQKNTIVLSNDLNISRQHCSISRDNDQFYISDSGSTHGTFVNQEKLTSMSNPPRQLQTGEIVSLGSAQPDSAILWFTVPEIKPELT